jgi:glycosyltransferase involved in cell wall biosynthesis
MSEKTTSIPTVSVVIAAFASDRWEQLRAAVASVAAQSRPALETIVVIDHNPALLDRARRELGENVAWIIPNEGARGASGARNTGVAVSRGDIIAFLDDDARAFSGWLAAITANFTDSGVVGAGGRIEPLWATSRPRWFPGEFDWAIGGSYQGMPDTATVVRNVWSGNMAVRRTAFEAVGGFREDFGKVGGRSQPEDTDLCLRASSGSWVYDPAAAVGHWVPAQRATLGYFLRRCYNEGRGKAALASGNGGTASLSAERGYTRTVLPRAVAAGLRDAVTRDLAGALRSGAILAGLGVAGAGFAVGWLSGQFGGAR